MDASNAGYQLELGALSGPAPPGDRVKRRRGGPEAKRRVLPDGEQFALFERDAVEWLRTLPDESIDLIDAFHPQTILAYQLNGKDLEVAHGAPLRLRVERHLGYKQAKYLMRIEIKDRFTDLWGGKGGFWEDRGYEWYAGI